MKLVNKSLNIRKLLKTDKFHGALFFFAAFAAANMKVDKTTFSNLHNSHVVMRYYHFFFLGINISIFFNIAIAYLEKHKNNQNTKIHFCCSISSMWI